MPLKKIHKLNYSHDYSFVVIGITSDEKDYKLIWDINSLTGWNLERKDNYRYYNPKTKVESEFPLYLYNDENSYISYKIIANKYDNHSLLDELRNLDYLLIVFDETGDENYSRLSVKLKKIESIRAVFLIDPLKLKNRERLLF